jgi:uncharacterized membrane protein YtjA (UPF0391 family)
MLYWALVFLLAAVIVTATGIEPGERSLSPLATLLAAFFVTLFSLALLAHRARARP